jgi:hypothetical protein
MLSFRRIAAVRTVSSAVGVVLGLSSTVAAPQTTDGQSVSHPIVSGHRQTTPAETGRTTPELRTTRSAQPMRAEDHAVQQLYDEIEREADLRAPALSVGSPK